MTIVYNWIVIKTIYTITNKDQLSYGMLVCVCVCVILMTMEWTRNILPVN